MKYDLHTHTNFSDGDNSPSDLVEKAKLANITHLALTDHDTIDGLSEASQAAARRNITLIPGIEFSCTWRDQLIHIVGLNIDPTARALKQAINENKERRKLRAEAMFEDFEQNGIEIRAQVEDQIGLRGVPTRPHFAQALVNEGFAKDKKQAFKRYLTKGKVGYVPMKWPDLETIGNAIVKSGGIGVLAHPMRYKFTRTKLCHLLKDQVAAGITGLEICTASTDKQQIRMLSDLARRFNLQGSTGSDYHSDTQPWAKLGRFSDLPEDVIPVWNTF